MEHKDNATEKSSKNYTLKSDAVDTLAGNNAEGTPTYSKEELHKYRRRGGIHIPNWLKVIGIKAWFAGAVCFFFLWGLGTYISGLDMLVVTGLCMGVVTDLLVNNSIRFIEKNPGENDVFMMIPPRGVRSFVLNLIYSCVILACVYQFYQIINTILSVLGGENAHYLGVEPVLFGLLCMGFDMLFVGMKTLLRRIIRDAVQTARSGK